MDSTYQINQGSTTGANQGVSGTNGTQQQQNQFNPGQQGLQGSLGGMYQNFLSGQVPQSFTAPPQVLDAYKQYFQNQVAPGIAAQYGAGSPQMGAQQTNGLTQLLANLYQQGMSNYGNVLGGASSYALNPTGYNQSQNQGTQYQNQSAENYNQTTYSPLSILMQLLGQAP